MPMTLAYDIALAEARSCLAALADGATDVDESSQVEHVLIALDELHPDGPATYPLDGRQADLTRWLESAIDRMIELAATPSLLNCCWPRHPGATERGKAPTVRPAAGSLSLP